VFFLSPSPHYSSLVIFARGLVSAHQELQAARGAAEARLALHREAAETAARDAEAAWTARWETLPAHQQQRLAEERDQIANAEAKARALSLGRRVPFFGGFVTKCYC
jgi:hypothetical protein